MNALVPLAVPAIAALGALVVAAVNPNDRKVGAGLTIAAAVVTVALLFQQGWFSSPVTALGMIALDRYTAFFTVLVMTLLVAAALMALASFRSGQHAHGEFWALALFAVSGMIVLAASTHLALTFIGVEVMSLSIYALVGSDRQLSRPPEAALKYFLLGAFSSAFLLFGIAFVYGAVGSLDLVEIRAALADGTRSATLFGQASGSHRGELLLGCCFLLAGFAFKTSAAPFHMWTPDAYTGAPTPVTAFMGSAVKIASFAAFVRIFISTLQPAATFWSDLVAVAAALTIIVGNLGAIAQREVKRMLAFSGIAHAGYLLVAIRAASIDLPGTRVEEPAVGATAVLFYLLAYGATVAGTFAVVTILERRRGRELVLDDLAGVAQRHPGLAAALVVFMLALAGVPPTAGFAAKLYVFSAAVNVGDYLLAVIGVLFSAVSLFYYLRILVFTYMRDPGAAETEEPKPAGAYAVAIVAALVVLLVGIAPARFLTVSRLAVESTWQGRMPATAGDAGVASR